MGDNPSRWDRLRATVTYPVTAALLTTLLFVLLCSVELDGQGLYYDEVHQAPASFLLLGKAPYTFTPLAWGKIPLLTMPYSGAVRSILYGGWMKLSGMGFTVISWRLFGILIAGAGLFLFCVLAARALQPAGLGVFLAFLLSDVSVLLMSRHDLGPVAVALALRLIWLGVWIRTEIAEGSETVGWFVLGFLPAFSVYEKLNNVVLLGPLALVALLSRKRFSVKRVAAAFLGFVAGLIPLAVVNLMTSGISVRVYLESSAKAASQGVVPGEIISLLAGFLSLGDGQEVGQFVLGVPPVPWVRVPEVAFLILSLLGAGIVAGGYWRKDPRARMAAISLMGYLSILLITLVFLLKESSPHHWITGTPFQYLSIALAADVFRRNLLSRSAFGIKFPVEKRLIRVLPAVALLLFFILLRGYNVMAFEKNLAARRASPAWDPSYTEVARFAVERGKDSSFIAADWGFAPQIYSLSNGDFPVAEPIWSWGTWWGPDLLRRYLSQKPGRPAYVLLRKLDAPLFPSATEDIVRVVSDLAGGKQLPLEEELRNYRSVRVLKFPTPDR